MTETDIRVTVLNKLNAEYGKDRVVAEPRIEGEDTLRADFAVYRDSSHDNLLLLIECSSLRTDYRQKQDFTRARDLLLKSDSEYAALISPSVEFVFSAESVNGRPLLTSHAALPSVDGEISRKQRAIQSEQELDFLIDRALGEWESLRRLVDVQENDIPDLYQVLHILLEAERSAQELVVDGNLKQPLADLTARLDEKFDAYTPPGLETEFVRSVCGTFAGFSLQDTPTEIQQAMLDIQSEDKRTAEQSTPLGLARELVRLSGVDSGETVLDPAAGRGTILCCASGQGAMGVGVEINGTATNCGLFLTDLLSCDVKYNKSDFFTVGTNELPENIDHVIVDPPFNADVDASSIPGASNSSSVHSQDAFIAKGLSLLSDGGTLTAIVPAGFLFQVRSEWIRSLIREDYRLDSIIQIRDGPIYRNTQIDTSIISVTKTDSDSTGDVDTVVINSPDDVLEALKEATTKINSGSTNSVSLEKLDQSFNVFEIEGQESVLEKLREKYGSVTTVDSIASVHRGAHPNERFDEPSERRIRLLDAKDVRQKKSQHEITYVDEEEVDTIADESSVVLVAVGQTNLAYIPSEPVAATPNLAVLDFDSPEAALVYKTFFETDLGEEQLNTLKKGTTVTRISLRSLREAYLPDFDREAIKTRAQAIRDYQERIAELQSERERLENETEDLLSGMENDE